MARIPELSELILAIKGTASTLTKQVAILESRVVDQDTNNPSVISRLTPEEAKAAREFLGLTQVDMALVVGACNNTFVCRWETSYTHRPNLAYSKAILAAVYKKGVQNSGWPATTTLEQTLQYLMQLVKTGQQSATKP